MKLTQAQRNHFLTRIRELSNVKAPVLAPLNISSSNYLTWERKLRLLNEGKFTVRPHETVADSVRFRSDSLDTYIDFPSYHEVRDKESRVYGIRRKLEQLKQDCLRPYITILEDTIAFAKTGEEVSAAIKTFEEVVIPPELYEDQFREYLEAVEDWKKAFQ